MSKITWLGLILWTLVFVVALLAGCKLADQYELNKAAKAVLETPNLSEAFDRHK